MHGLIHDCLKELILRKFGKEVLEKILAECGADPEDHFMVFKTYDDAVTMPVITAAVKVLELDLNTVLEVFGGFFYEYVKEKGYGQTMKTLAPDLRKFLENLDFHHFFLDKHVLVSQKMESPTFRCETDELDGQLLLHYNSARMGLHPLVTGIIKALAKDVYHQKVETEVISQTTQETLTSTRHITVLKITDIILENTDKIESFNDAMVLRTKSRLEQEDFLLQESLQTKLHLSPYDFNNIFPFYITFDRKMKVLEVGNRLAAHCNIRNGTHVSKYVNIIHPHGVKMEWDSISHYLNSIFLVWVVADDFSNGPDLPEEQLTLKLKGTMLPILQQKAMMFLGTPMVTSLEQMRQTGLFLSDTPLHDAMRELVLLSEHRSAEIEISKQLEDSTIELKKLSKALEKEKGKTEELLSQMLPKQVAEQLKEGKTVEARSFDMVTILFSDIVTFTVISSSCKPEQVVTMLNELFTKFDFLTVQNDVYKVETIGDAFMVAGGVPVPVDDHAVRVVKQGLDMLSVAGEVLTPHENKPIQIRVGIHSGPVMAGVVGKKMPRYCLFGDSVNTASRMESHGVPGKCHISASCNKLINTNGDFMIKERGIVEIKGKGEMKTYYARRKTSTDRSLVDIHEPASIEELGESKKKLESGLPPRESKTCVIA